MLLIKHYCVCNSLLGRSIADIAFYSERLQQLILLYILAAVRMRAMYTLLTALMRMPGFALRVHVCIKRAGKDSAPAKPHWVEDPDEGRVKMWIRAVGSA